VKSKSPFYEQLSYAVERLGGIYNAHLHLDRSGTLEVGSSGLSSGSPIADSSLSLKDKHGLITKIHQGPDFAAESLSTRVNRYIDAMVAAGTRRADTLVDVGTNGIGLSALKTMLEIKEQREPDIDLRLGAYSPLGFCDAEPERWELLVQGAELADFIGSLPERDDDTVYPGHIGFDEHCRRILELADGINKPLQMHLDQQNNPLENDTERFLEILENARGSASPRNDTDIWLVHVISPSRYGEDRFESLVNGLVRYNVGVICCPSAAISMRQLRSQMTPTSNSIARVLEMLAAGVHVCLGSDNIADIFSPAGTPDLIDEVFVLCNALRFYNIEILAKLAAGVRISPEERALIKDHLLEDRELVNSMVATRSCDD